MSSFRIDRQYVSFVTAETKSVPHPQEYSVGTGSSGTDGRTAQEDPQCVEIMNKARETARREAALLLEQARSEADGILLRAKRQADGMTEEAKSRAAAIREDAKRSGYSEGRKTAEAEAAQRRSEEAGQYAQLVHKLQEDYAGLVDGMREEIIALVINIVKKVIDFKINHSDEIFLGIVNNALEQLKQSKTVIIHVRSEDYQRYFGSDAENGLHLDKANVSVTEEEGYAPGDLMVESEGEMLDFSIGRQIERVEKALLKGET